MIRFFRWHRDHYKGRNLGFILPVKFSSREKQVLCIIFSENGKLGSQRSSPFGYLYDTNFKNPSITDPQNNSKLLSAIGRWGRQAVREVFERWNQMP